MAKKSVDGLQLRMFENRESPKTITRDQVLDCAMTTPQAQMRDRLDHIKHRDANKNNLSRRVAAVASRQGAEMKRVITDLVTAATGVLERWRAAPANSRNVAGENRDGTTAAQPAETEKSVKELLTAAREDFEREKLEDALKQVQKEFDLKYTGSPHQKKQELQRLLDEKFAEARNILARKLQDEKRGAAEKAQAEAQNSVVSLTGRLSETREARTIKTGRPTANDTAARAIRVHAAWR